MGIKEVTESYYAVYDGYYEEENPPGAMANFDSLTGGDQTIAMIPYTQVFEDGGSTTKFLPGQISFEPVVLLRGFDARVPDLYKWFEDTAAGKFDKVKKNISIVMIDREAGPQVIWDLFNTIPVGISGFSFNQTTENSYTDFELTLQAELITMRIPEGGDDEE
jgi:phage tail-like protein